MSTKHRNTAIAHAMEFTSSDLTHNRRGELSADQRLKLEVMRDVLVSDLEESPPLHIPSIITLVVIGIVALILHFLGMFTRLQQWLPNLYLPLLIGGGLFILGRFVWTQFRYVTVHTLLPDMLDELIQTVPLYSITGEASLSIEKLPYTTNYWLNIGDERFPLTTSAGDVFQDGSIYRVFYVHFADTTVLMSAEVIKDKAR
jgi:hypothetical protein